MPKRAITLEIELLNVTFFIFASSAKRSLFYIVGNENRKTSWIVTIYEGDRNVSLKERKKEKSN